MKHLLTAAFLALPGLAQAECAGLGFDSMMSAPERESFAQSISEIPFAEGVFWQAHKGDAHISLIGTVHMADPRLEPFVARAMPWLDGVDALWVEAGPEEMAKLQNAMATDPTLMFDPEGPTLPEQLPAESWDYVREAAAARGIPSPLAAKMRPWFLTMTLSLPACAMPSLMAGEMGLDQLLIEEAKSAELPIRALEPWDTALNIFREAPEDEQLLALRNAATTPELADAAFVSLMNYYFDEKIGAIWSMVEPLALRVPGFDAEEAARVLAEMEQSLLIERNAAWLPQIEAAAAEGPITVAVGAAHLQGAHGLLKLLEDNGWTLTRH